MSLPAYCAALASFARARLQAHAGQPWARRLQSLCPEFYSKVSAQELQAQAPDVQGLFGALLGLIEQELHSLAAFSGHAYPARKQGGGFAYSVGEHRLWVSSRDLFELWRFGVALRNPEAAPMELQREVLAHAQAWLIKEVQGAWRVAQRRSKAFGRAQQVLHPAGQERQAQARAVESALAILLSDETLASRRADLATDWLQGVDLWWHRPGQSPHKGQPVALSVTMSNEVQSRKAQSGITLWTPQRLAEAMRDDLQGHKGQARVSLAQAAWEGLGSPVDTSAIATELLRACTELTKAQRGVHPAALLDARVGHWLRAQR